MIRKFTQNGYYIVLDIDSGAVHLADKIMYDMLDFFSDNCVPEFEQIENKMNTYEKCEIKECYDEILQLISEKSLFTTTDYEQYTDKLKTSPVKAMCLHIAHDCNLKCEYCFASKGNFGGTPMLMSYDIGRKAIDFIIENSHNRKNIEIDFFGGEPLMNFNVVKQIVEYARSREEEHGKLFRFTITTNGLLLTDDKIEYINKEMSNVVLSIDGRKEINDRLRTKKNGKGCYDDIVPKYLKLIKNRTTDYYVRGTFTKYNLDFSEDVFHLNDLGFEQISVEPVVSDKRLDYSINESDLPAIFEEYETLTKRLSEHRKAGKRHLNFFHFMIDLDHGSCAIKRIKGCGCGNEYVAVTPEGDIYPCHQFVGMDEWKMGTVDSGITRQDIRESFQNTNIYTKKGCRDCWAKFWCSGGCNANNYQYEGDVLTPHKLSCELQKKRLECAIALAADR